MSGEEPELGGVDDGTPAPEPPELQATASTMKLARSAASRATKLRGFDDRILSPPVRASVLGGLEREPAPFRGGAHDKDQGALRGTLLSDRPVLELCEPPASDRDLTVAGRRGVEGESDPARVSFGPDELPRRVLEDEALAELQLHRKQPSAAPLESDGREELGNGSPSAPGAGGGEVERGAAREVHGIHQADEASRFPIELHGDESTIARARVQLAAARASD